MLGELTLWFLADAAGPLGVERLLHRITDRHEWFGKIAADLADEEELSRAQRKTLRSWLESEYVAPILAGGLRDELEQAAGELATVLGVPPERAAELVDGVTARFLQALDPSTAIAVSEWRRGRAHEDVVRRLTVLQDEVRSLRARAVVHSVYRETVAEIAPQTLIGRRAELEELARFCTVPDGPAYAWWRARAWAGKSALMATFALHPPGGVDVVSFFVTARLAEQNDRDAFVDAILEQTTALLGEPPPAFLTGSTKVHHVRDRLNRAAERSAAQGRRLVLLVDGLDEDRGVSTGGHSIAGLLPRTPAAGMRVVVAGRPDPPVPSDVAYGHPLRDGRIVRILERSQEAQATRYTQERELHDLLRGGKTGLEILGLLVAAGGGLSADDLADLADADTWAVGDVLGGVTGRSFHRRRSRFQGSDTFILGHEELARSAATALAKRLPGHRERLHAWAESWRDRGWPEETPEYLLRGYVRMLQSLGTPDAETRLVRLAVDRARHDRMLDVTGGDSLALLEVAAGHAAVAENPDIHLAHLLRLARRRGELAARNDHVPRELPALWASLGHRRRAESLAHGIPTVAARDAALAEVAVTLAESGDAGAGEELAESVRDARGRATALAGIAATLAADGDRARALGFAAAAESVLTSIASTSVSARTTSDLFALAHAYAVAGDDPAALRVANHVQDAGQRAALHGQLAAPLSEAGHRVEAMAHARTAEAIAHRADPVPRVQVWTGLTTTYLALGDVVRARSVAAEAERQSDAIHDPAVRAPMLARLVRPLAACGSPRDAVRVAQAALEALQDLDEESTGPEQLDALAIALLTVGDGASAVHEADRYRDKGKASALLSRLAITAGPDHAQAGELVRAAEARAQEIAEVRARAAALVEVAGALAALGDTDGAVRVAESVRGLTAGFHEPLDRDEQLTPLAAVLARAGRTGPAADILAQLSDSAARAQELTDLGILLGAGGERELALEAARAAEAAARTAVSVWWEVAPTSALARALVIAGEHDLASRVATSSPNELVRTHAAAELIPRLVAAGAPDRARAVAYATRRPGSRAVDPTDRALGAADVAVRLAGLGDLDGAQEFVRAAEAAAFSVPGVTSLADTLLDLLRTLIPREASLVTASLVAATEQAVAAVPADDGLSHRLTALAHVLHLTGHEERTGELLHLAMAAATSLPGPQARDEAVAVVTASFAALTGNVPGNVGDALAVTDWMPRTRLAVARALTDRGDHDAALRLAGELEAQARRSPDEGRGSDVLRDVALLLAAAGDHAGATRLAGDDRSPLVRSSRMADVADGVRASGDLIAAERIAQEIEGAWDRAGALRSIALDAAAEDPGKALALLRAATDAARGAADPEDAAAMRCWIAEDLVGLGEHEQARELVRETAAEALHGQVQSSTLAGLAAAWLDAGGDVTEGRRLAVSASGVADWWDLAEVLGRVAPEAVVAVAGDVIREADGG